MYFMFRSKVIYLVCYGQGVYNVFGEIDYVNYKFWDYMDVFFIDLGRQQVEVFYDYVEVMGIKVQVELVVVFFFLCILQIVIRVWGEVVLLEGEFFLLVSRLGKFQYVFIVFLRLLKFVVNEWCCERIGVNLCDRCFNIFIYRKDFFGVDFLEVQIDEDMWWYDIKCEINEEVFDRVRVLVRWLLDCFEL